MNNYKAIQEVLQNNFTLDLMRRGMISLKMLDYKVYYEKYIFYKRDNPQMEAITLTADECRVSENTIRNAIKFMLEC